MRFFKISTKFWSPENEPIEFPHFANLFFAGSGLFAVGQSRIQGEVSIRPKVEIWSFYSCGYWRQPKSDAIGRFLVQFCYFYLMKAYLILKLVLPWKLIKAVNSFRLTYLTRWLNLVCNIVILQLCMYTCCRGSKLRRGARGNPAFPVPLSYTMHHTLQVMQRQIAYKS